MDTVDLIRQKLNTLSPSTLEIFDDSHEHAGHAGARESGGGHFQVFIVSDIFAGKNKVARHRMIYQAVGELMPAKIHALAIQAFTSDEVDAPDDVSAGGRS
ncbi:MAG TPA: BolA family protein [Burkholderiales bacterium]|nr:BolA family protein [Burkholderiales bacterium]